MLKILLRMLLGLVLLVAVWLFTLGGMYWFGLRDSGYDPPIPVSVANILSSYNVQPDNPDAWRWDRTHVLVKNIEVDLTRTLKGPSDDIWRYVPVKGTDDRLWVEYWQMDVPPAGPFTLIGYQLHTAPTSTPLPESLAKQANEGKLYVVEYANRSYYRYQHQDAISFFIGGAFILVLAAIGTGIVYGIAWLIRRQKAAVARLAAEPTTPAEIAAAQARHARLLDTLRDCGVDRAPNPAGRWILSVIVVIALGIVAAIGNAIVNSAATGPDGPFIRAIWLVFGIFVLARVRNWFLRSAWKSNAYSAEKELNRASSRQPILYLRSFQLDEQIGRPSWIERLLGTIPMQTAEQKVTKVLRKYGPVIAIGRPSERLPPLGAARFYVSHDRWKDKVTEIARESRFVVWATGVTEGLMWEIGHLVENVPPENVILWAHPHLLRLGPAKREEEWSKFRSILGHLFPKPLPEKLGEARFFYFTKDWEPRAVAPPRRPWTWFAGVASALRALLGVKQGTLSEAQAVYPGPQPEDEFAGLIGASAQPLRWERPAAWLGANLFAQILLLFTGPADFFVRVVPNATLFCAAALAAYRYLPAGLAPFVAAIVPALFAWFFSGYDPVMAAGTTYIGNLAFLIGLAWATRRIRPLWLALFLGAMWRPIVSQLIDYYRFGSVERYADVERYGALTLWRPWLVPVLFAGSLAAAIWFIDSREQTEGRG